MLGEYSAIKLHPLSKITGSKTLMNLPSVFCSLSSRKAMIVSALLVALSPSTGHPAGGQECICEMNTSIMVQIPATFHNHKSSKFNTQLLLSSNGGGSQSSPHARQNGSALSVFDPLPLNMVGLGQPEGSFGKSVPEVSDNKVKRLKLAADTLHWL